MGNGPSFLRIYEHDNIYSSNIDIAIKSVIVHLKPHPIFNLVILKGNMVFVDDVSLLQADLLRTSANLGRNEFLELEDGVGWTAFNTLALSEAVISNDLNENWSVGVVDQLALAHQVEHLDLFCNWEV